jgi:hypothetical protein
MHGLCLIDAVWARLLRFPLRARESVPAASKSTSEEKAMGKYFLAWLLGVPAFVLVIVYLFFN